MHSLKNKTQIGIEITAQEVRATAVTLSHQQLPVVTTAVFPIITTVEDSLKQAQQQWNYQQEKTIFAIHYEEAIDKIIQLPPTLSDEEISTYIKNQSVKLFGLPAQTLAIDYRPLPFHITPHSWQVIVTKKAYLEKTLALCHALKFNLTAMDVNFLALSRAYYYLHETANENIAIAFLEFTCVTLCVFNQQQLIHHVNISLSTPLNECYWQKLTVVITQFFQQTNHSFFATALYLVNTFPIAEDFIAMLQNTIHIPCQLARLLPKKIRLLTPFDSCSLISFSLALWN